ncbi:hypothetical protein GYC09_004618 [Salmonella enterica]|nr:hypothetical protein [Salmonella enterica]
MTKAPKETLRGAGRVAFLARVADFRELVEAGHPLLGIYESNKDELGISYSQFARYVAKYIRSPSHEQEAHGRQPSAPSAPAAQASPPAPAPATGGGSGASRPAGKPAPAAAKPGAFQHNATDNKRDDLI